MIGAIIAVVVIWTLAGFAVKPQESGDFAPWQELLMFPMLLLLAAVFWVAQMFDRMVGLGDED